MSQSKENIHYEFGIRNIYDAIVDQKIYVVLSVSVFLAAAVAYAVFKDPVYKTSAVLVYVDTQDQVSVGSGLLGQLGGLAALTGIRLGATGSGNKHEAIATLRSRTFLNSFIERYELLPVLFASDWDDTDAKWLVEDIEDIPTLADAYVKFTEEVMRIDEDSLSGLLVLSIEWTDPEIATFWANQLIADVNLQLKTQAIKEANLSIDYLNAELEKTQVVELKQNIYGLLEEQINKIMLASVRNEYAFRKLDPAFVPEDDDFVRPDRPIVIAVGLMLGLIVGISFALIRYSIVR